MSRIVMVYPRPGFSGAYVKHLPLSLLYAVTEVIKRGHEVVVVDTRVVEDWRAALAAAITPDTLCVGLSVMSGTPIRHAIAIGRTVKALAPDLPVVWGGPHATFYPESILRDEPSADYVISGYGAHSFAALVEALARSERPRSIGGCAWRKADGRLALNPNDQTAFEFIDWRDIPYDLIPDFAPYGQLDQDKRIFSMFSAMGCPYQCTFCSSPAQYARIEGRKWVPIEHTAILDHIEHVVTRYDANYIYFIDDDSFPSLKHVEGIIDGIRERGLPVRLGFRGARINEIKRMSDAFLDKLAEAGTDMMHIGAESGSDRILALMKKTCTVEDILDCNRKLARHPSITAAYNFIMGVPTETLDDLHRTRDLMLRLVEDNPHCLVFPPNKFRPLPGTELYEVARREWNYAMPDTLAAWADIEVEGKAESQWYEPGMARFFDMMLITSYFVDNKIARVTSGTTPLTRFARLANLLYRPFARWRMRHGITAFLAEYWAYRAFLGVMGWLQRRRDHAMAD